MLMGMAIFSCSNQQQQPTEQIMEASPVEENQDPQLRHVVLFKFKEGTDPAAIKAVEEAFADLQNKIPEIKDFEWGLNNSPEGLDKGFTHCFILTFDNEEGRAVYLPHPDHKAFGALLKDILEDVTVVDFYTN